LIQNPDNGFLIAPTCFSRLVEVVLPSLDSLIDFYNGRQKISRTLSNPIHYSLALFVSVPKTRLGMDGTKGEEDMVLDDWITVKLEDAVFDSGLGLIASIDNGFLDPITGEDKTKFEDWFWTINTSSLIHLTESIRKALSSKSGMFLEAVARLFKHRVMFPITITVCCWSGASFLEMASQSLILPTSSGMIDFTFARFQEVFKVVWNFSDIAQNF
jgi:hypothetical protein